MRDFEVDALAVCRVSIELEISVAYKNETLNYLNYRGFSTERVAPAAKTAIIATTRSLRGEQRSSLPPLIELLSPQNDATALLKLQRSVCR